MDRMTKRTRAARGCRRGELPGTTVLPGPTDRVVRVALDGIMDRMEQDFPTIEAALLRALARARARNEVRSPCSQLRP